MTKKLATGEFIDKAKNTHGNKYDYGKSIYIVSAKKLTITCKIHGDFLQSPNKHLMGRGCPRCASEKRRVSQTRSQDGFISEAKNTHGDRFEYSKSVYVSSHEKLVITCKKHGDFLQSPASHLQGIGCAKCGFDLTAWNRSAYTKCAEKNGKSCVYLINCFNDSESFYKIGITSTAFNYRFKKNKMPYNFKVISTVSNGAKQDWDDEKKIHKSLRLFRYTPSVAFGGMTECFSELTDEVKQFFGVAK